MTGEFFEWDDEKSAVNLRNHGVSFQDAVLAFRDTFGVERIDSRKDYGEERINLVGMWRDHAPCDVHRARRSHSDHFGQTGGKT
jgi:uncharacterized DUF497 family protein